MVPLFLQDSSFSGSHSAHELTCADEFVNDIHKGICTVKLGKQHSLQDKAVDLGIKFLFPAVTSGESLCLFPLALSVNVLSSSGQGRSHNGPLF